MGTNYYARYSPCPTCNRCSAEKHIGKASCGWRFMFRSNGEIYSWKSWKEEFKRPGVEIWNEYNDKIPIEELIDLVELKQRDPGNKPHINHLYWFQDDDGYDFSNTDFS